MRNWGIYVVVALGYIIYNVSTTADRDESGAIVDGGNVDAFNIRVGDCFDDTSSLLGEEVTSLPAVPCTEPHDNEVYAVFDVSVSDYPGADQMSVMAFDACKQRFQHFVGKEYDSSTLDIMTLHPSSESWRVQNDREVVCALYDMEGNKVTGSAKGRAI